MRIGADQSAVGTINRPLRLDGELGIIHSCACAAQQVYCSCWATYMRLSVATPGRSEPEMPKATAYRLTWLPEGEVYELRESQSNQVLPVAPGSPAWFAWLTAVPSFT